MDSIVLVVERESLEYNHLGILVNGSDSCFDRGLAVAHLVLLLLEGVFLEELVQTAVCDVVDHCLRSRVPGLPAQE